MADDKKKEQDEKIKDAIKEEGDKTEVKPALGAIKNKIAGKKKKGE